MICHMTTSIDGKVTGKFLETPQGLMASDEYYRVHRDFHADAFACGRITMEGSLTHLRGVKKKGTQTGEKKKKKKRRGKKKKKEKEGGGREKKTPAELPENHGRPGIRRELGKQDLR